MFKKLILTFLISTLSLFSQAVFADSIPVENVFIDIDSDYKYIHELQTLYDRGMIFPDSEGKFNPRELLNRDEFVGILMEVTCKDCIQPDTSLYFLDKYENKSIFYDLDKTNKYFYCIAEATNEGFVSGYHEGTACEDGTSMEGEKPFCPNNTIILEEAIAIILRASGILSNQEAESIRQDIVDGKITEWISDDVGPTNLDGSVYSFYPDLKTALEYEVLDVDKNGNVKSYNLIELVDGKIRPKKAISKEDFLRIAYVTLKANSCELKSDNNLALKVLVFDKSCTESNQNCNISDLNDQTNTYDFSNEVVTTCESGVTNPEGYIRRFYNNDTGQEMKRYGSFQDNHTLLSDGNWSVFLRVIDKCGNTAEVYNTIIVSSQNDLKVSLLANPIYGTRPLLVDFEGVVNGGVSPYTYYWNFGDSNNGIGKNTSNVFKQNGIYETVLTVKDSVGNMGDASALIQVIGEENIFDNDGNLLELNLKNQNQDTDKDGIYDINDLCPLLEGEEKNSGCPILEKECNSENDCDDAYYCSEVNNACLPKLLDNTCEYNGGDVIFGNMICNSCPCNYFLDFTSTIRKCDIIFPAITSPDSLNIYSRGELYQIKRTD